MTTNTRKSHPFKRGDKVVRLAEHYNADWTLGNTVCTVLSTAFYYYSGEPSVFLYEDGGTRSYDADRFRAAIAGQDYPALPPVSAGVAHYAGHLPDGSSVQKHSAGPLYPCVIAMRDGILGGKYDYGVISPRNQEPLWLSTHEAAMLVAETIKKDLT